jgi:hypothetical protein
LTTRVVEVVTARARITHTLAGARFSAEESTFGAGQGDLTAFTPPWSVLESSWKYVWSQFPPLAERGLNLFSFSIHIGTTVLTLTVVVFLDVPTRLTVTANVVHPLVRNKTDDLEIGRDTQDLDLDYGLYVCPVVARETSQFTAFEAGTGAVVQQSLGLEGVVDVLTPSNDILLEYLPWSILTIQNGNFDECSVNQCTFT